MVSFIDSTGKVIKSRSIREFSERYSLSYESARALKSGRRVRINGWCSTHKKAKRLRERFMTKLVNLKTGDEFILGQSIRAFADTHGLCMNELWKLVNGQKIAYRGFVLGATRDAVLAGSKNIK